MRKRQQQPGEGTQGNILYMVDARREKANMDAKDELRRLAEGISSPEGNTEDILQKSGKVVTLGSNTYITLNGDINITIASDDLADRRRKVRSV